LEHESIISAAHAAIERFLAAASKPSAFEPGSEPIDLLPEQYTVDLQGGRLTFQAWDRDRNLVRRVTSVESESAGRLDLVIERFGKRTGILTLLDNGRPAAQSAAKRAGRLVFREWFRRALSRQFAGWRIAELTAGADLEHSLSPAYTRALLTRGTTAIAALGAPDEAAADGALSFGLIWLDYVRKREARLSVEGLALFLPEGHERTTCLRIRCLDQRTAMFTTFVYGGGFEARIDIADAGNLETRLPVRDSQITTPDWMSGIERLEGVERIDCARDNVSWRVRGCEIATWDGEELRFGLVPRQPARASNRAEIECLASEVARMRRPGSAGPLYAAAPERWLESQIRQHLVSIDAGLIERPVYGQVPSFAAAERGVLDLLAACHDGRLAVIEVKCSEDLHLPLQALDYWMRVRWHALQDDFARQGYFPGRRLPHCAPRLLLVAPALCFHPTTATILRFFAPEIDVERIGVGMDWRSRLKVVFRATGCDDITEGG
jgi:hypothetical protein